MSKPDVKETIIEAAKALIVLSEGDVDSVTTRSIAEKAGVGIGLINYHFQTKDHLIEICVQRIIGNVIKEFKPAVDASLDGVEKLKTVAKQVVDFLMGNPSVSRISILGDYSSPQLKDNTMKTVQGFLMSTKNLELDDKHKKLLLFGLTSILQALFLRKDSMRDCLDVDYNQKEERDELIDFYIETIFGGMRI